MAVKNSFYRNPLEFHSQAGQDVIENGRGTGTGGFGMCSSQTRAIDRVQYILWDDGIRIDVKSLNSERKTVMLVGDYSDFLIAKKILSVKKPGFEVFFQPSKK